MPVGSRLLGSPRFCVQACFQARSTYSRPAVRRSVCLGFILWLRVLSRVPSLPLPPAPLGAGALPGFLPSSRRHRARPHLARPPRASLRSVRRCSQPLDGLLRAPAPRACFIPQPLKGHLPVQGLLSLCSHGFLVGSESPLAVGDGRSVSSRSQATRRRLGFEVFIRTGPRSGRSGD